MIRKDQNEEKLVSNVLKICYEIRERLKINCKIPSDYEIVVLNDDSNYLGFCFAEWSTEIKVQKRAIRVFSKDNGLVFQMPSIILTFLHELAHTITRYNESLNSSSSLLNKNKKAWIHPDHDDEFYDNYRQILEEAENQKILILPKVSNKFGKRSLQRLDFIDVNYTELSNSSTIYRHIDFNEDEISKEPLLVKLHYNNLIKIFLLEKRNMDDLLKTIKNKINGKFKTITIDNEENLKEETLMKARKELSLFLKK